MTESESQFPNPAIRDYNYHDDPTHAETAPDEALHVIVPSDPPEFGPAAARALLRLLLAVHRSRAEANDTSGEEP
jgi:hypothetical protein